MPHTHMHPNPATSPHVQAVALGSGFLKIVNTADLTDVHVARNTAHNILCLATASTCRHVAVADAANQVR